jgi:GNAT superfamily N-acetyltransferase
MRALADAPYAYGSTLATEQEYDEARWQQWIAESAIFLAGDSGVLGAMQLHETRSRFLYAMWVAPPARGTGTAQALVDAAAKWARSEGVNELTLYVADGNERAFRMFEKLGFTKTGVCKALRDGEPDLCHEMRRSL